MKEVKEKTATKAAPAKKEAKVKVVKEQPKYKTLTVKKTKDAEGTITYQAFDETGKQYTAADCPRQVMMRLAHEKGQVLYFRGKKWRRKVAEATVTVAPVPAKSKLTKAEEKEEAAIARAEEQNS